jgi:hypothetical protein
MYVCTVLTYYRYENNFFMRKGIKLDETGQWASTDVHGVHFPSGGNRTNLLKLTSLGESKGSCRLNNRHSIHLLAPMQGYWQEQKIIF